MIATFVIYESDDVGIDYTNKLTERVLQKNIGSISWESKKDDSGRSFFEVKFDVPQENLILL